MPGETGLNSQAPLNCVIGSRPVSRGPRDESLGGAPRRGLVLYRGGYAWKDALILLL